MLSIEKQKDRRFKMEEKEIHEIFEEIKIEIKSITKAINSFNSNVYIIKTKDKKYVLKVSNNEKKKIIESKYMRYLSAYLPTATIITTGTKNDKNYIVMTFLEGENKLDEEANNLSDKQLRNIGILLGKLHSAALLDEDNDSWISYLNDCLEKTQDVLKKVFGSDNDIIYNYLKNYIEKELKGKYQNSILHMDFRIGNLIFRDEDVGLIDMESMKNGEYVFDFVKTNRVLAKDKFLILLNGYKEIKNIDDNFYDKLNFYSLFDSYTSLWWSASRNKTDSDFYKMNYEIVMDYLGVLNEKGNL